MNTELFCDRLFNDLITGNRDAARMTVREAITSGADAETLAHDLFWPVLETIGQVFRADQMTTLAHHYAMRLLRSLVDQAQAGYRQAERRDRKILMFCGESEADELAGQLVADLVEADGYETFFGGGGVATDEILEAVGAHRPDVLLLFSSGPRDAPEIRRLIDTVREIAACPDLQIVVGGGVFNRAEGLAEEIGADLWARDPRDLLACMDEEPERRATTCQRTVGRTRRNVA